MSTRSPLGKRKRRTEVATADSSDHTGADEQDINDIFRRAFEAKFKPLPVESEPDPSPALQAEPASEEEDTIWSGLSEDEAAVQVVEHTNPDLNTAVLDKSAKRAFMSSKPPSSKPTNTAPSRIKPTGTDAEEAANLANDLALQRLLGESHLLSGDASQGPMGRNRLVAAELRMQKLGAKSNMLEQKSMPMSHRKGIVAKAQRKESERRREAKENGIVLERPSSKRKDEGRRERGVGGPGIGKFRGGTLSLSRKDVQDITGSGRGRGGKSRGRGRR